MTSQKNILMLLSTGGKTLQIFGTRVLMIKASHYPQ